MSGRSPDFWCIADVLDSDFCMTDCLGKAACDFWRADDVKGSASVQGACSPPSGAQPTILQCITYMLQAVQCIQYIVQAVHCCWTLTILVAYAPLQDLSGVLSASRVDQSYSRGIHICINSHAILHDCFSNH